MVKIVGKCCPGNWKMVKYTKNKGDVGRKRIVFIGCSYLFCHKVLRDMLLVGGFNNVEIVMHDIDEVPLNIVGDLMERIARQKKTKITVKKTLDRAEALKGADVVILSITVGGPEADFRSFEVCAKYGITVGVGDTLGPTALARCLREVPVVVEIARDMEKYCPNALMLNFSNPMSVITGAMSRTSSIPCWGLCHSADSLYDYFANVFHCSKSQLTLEVGGVNHQSFVTRLWVKGKERTGEILEAARKSEAKFKDTLLTTHEETTVLQQDVCKILGAWPSCGDTHLAEFYKWFFTPRRRDQFEYRYQVRPGRAPLGRRECAQIIRDWAYGPEPVGDLHLLTSEHAHELIWAWLSKEPFTRVLNLLNTGEYIRGLPKTACVEVLATVKGAKVTGKQITLPPVVHALVNDWTTIHELSFQAAMRCDRQAALQALFLDPHTSDLYDLEPMLEDMLQATRPWLPAKWFSGNGK